MPNFKLTIEYEGTAYYGWQRQKDKITVQEVLEKKLKKIFQEKITLIGQGRIDAGAHALGQTANFKVSRDFDVVNLKNALNSLLPFDIRIKKTQKEDGKFHARYSAKQRHYRYLVYNTELCVWLRKFAYFYPYDLDVKKMRKAANYLIGRHDFSPFQSTGSPVKNHKKNVKLIYIKRVDFAEVSVFTIDIAADAFLYRMVRNIVGSLIEVGRGKIQPEEVKRMLHKEVKRKSQTVPAYGLYLVEVKY